jgi:hypothetical protein
MDFFSYINPIIPAVIGLCGFILAIVFVATYFLNKIADEANANG